MDWIEERNAKGWVVSKELIKKYALEIFNKKGYDGEFTASDGWMTCFMNRKSLSLIEKTHQVRSEVYLQFITDRGTRLRFLRI